MALASSPDAASKELAKGHPRFFVPEKTQRFIMEISKAELASAAAASSGMGNQPQELMGAEVLVKALQAEGVKYVWGYPGGAVLYIYDAFYKQDTKIGRASCRERV